MKIILASASPRRWQLLSALGLQFTVCPSPAVEPEPTLGDCLDPGAFVKRLARLKAEAIESEDLIIAADTVVVSGGFILGKPVSEVNAREMLTELRGQTHRVFTGICVRQGERVESAHQVTYVTFGDFSDEFIAAYVKTGEPMDKAGAYAAQGKGALLVAKIEGDYWNVVGLPLFRLSQLLREFDVHIEASW